MDRMKRLGEEISRGGARGIYKEGMREREESN